jgi:hypothetical protein
MLYIFHATKINIESLIFIFFYLHNNIFSFDENKPAYLISNNYYLSYRVFFSFFFNAVEATLISFKINDIIF